MKVKETAKKPYGICPASMTIWNADQTYNKKGMEKYLTWLLDNGAQSISICGSTGENVAMNMEEQREIIGHVASFLNGQVPLICGTGRYDTLNTIKIFALGALAFIIASASGILFVKLMNLFLPKGKKLNPLIGNAGVSAVPMSARISNNLGLEYDRHNFLLMHAMGPNVAGVIGSAVAAGALLGFFN